MWNIHVVDGEMGVEDIVYREATISELEPDVANAPLISPAKYLGRVIATSLTEANLRDTIDLNLALKTLTKLEDAIPTWLSEYDEPEKKHEGLCTTDSTEWKFCVKCFGDPSGDPHGMVWLDDSYVLIWKPESVTTLNIEYTVPEKEYRRSLILEQDEPNGVASVALEWFATLGTSTPIHTGEEPLKPSGRVKKATLFLSERMGFILARIVRFKVISPPKRASDPYYQRRLHKLESESLLHNEMFNLVDKVPNLKSYLARFSIYEKDSQTTDQRIKELTTKHNHIKQIVVFVHGTFSCGIRMVSDICNDSSIRPDKNQLWLRYEHDTFFPIRDNADELSYFLQFLHKHVTKNILLVCHSRGGMVGISAFDTMLSKKLVEPETIEVCTYGTPHLGTPMASLAIETAVALRALLKASAQVGAKTFGLDPLGYTFGWLIGQMKIPDGILDMDPDGGNVWQHQNKQRTYYISAVGGYSDETSDLDGYFAAGFRLGVMTGLVDKDNKHDSVVEVTSSYGVGNSMCPPVKQCGHGDYFKRSDVMTYFKDRLSTGHWE